LAATELSNIGQMPVIEVFSVDGACCPPRLLEVLDGAERARHALALRHGRRGYGAGRVALRLLLGARLDLPPERVALVRHCAACGRGGHGKPALAGTARGELGFSVATAGSVTLIAVVRRGEVGVDLERVPAAGPLAWPRPWFSARERDELSRLGPRRRPEATARSWVRKEAVAKCVGQGLGMRLRRVEVTGAPPVWRLPDPSIEVVDLEVRFPLVAAVARDRPGAVPAVKDWHWGG
jgi:4'-phosphopantetheinyl transferase